MRYVVSFLAVFAWLVLLTTWTGCRRSADAPAPPKDEKPLTVGVCLGNVKDPWQAQMKSDVEAAAKKHPRLRLSIADADNAEAQKRILDKFLAQKVNLAIVAPLDAQEMTAPVAKLYEAGVPVIVLDRAVVGDKYTCYIAPDWVQIGSAAGEWLAEKLDGKENIVEIKGPVDSIPADRLHDAFRNQLRDPGYRFVFEGFVDPPRVGGAKLMTEAMADVDRIDAVFAFDVAAARAAYEAARAADRAKDTLFIGVGYLPEEIAKLVKDGVLSAAVLVPTGGVEAIRTAAKILSGEKAPKNIVPEPQVLSLPFPL